MHVNIQSCKYTLVIHTCIVPYNLYSKRQNTTIHHQESIYMYNCSTFSVTTTHTNMYMYRVLQFSSAIYSVHFFQFEPVLHHVYYRIVGVRVTHCYALIIIYMYNFTLLQVCLSQMAQTTMLKHEGLDYSFEYCLIGSILTTCRSSKKRFNQGFFSN